jgi:predicted dehydrogenase
MAPSQYRVGIVGCGWMGNDHAEAYRDHDRTTVVAAAEPDESTRDSFADRHGVDEMYADHDRMLEEHDLDIVSVCTWHSTHAQITVDVAEHGAEGIFCEKPMCTSLGEADAMLEAAESNDVTLTVGHQRRFDPVHEAARERIADGVIGEPRTIIANGGTGLLNWGTHQIDLTRYLLGDPGTKWIIGQFERETDRYERGLPIEDRCTGQVCFEGGTRLTVEMELPDPDVEENMINVYGTAGSMSLDLGTRAIVTAGDDTTEYTAERESSNRFAYLEDMLKAMEDDDHEHRCHGRQARRTIEIMMALYESTRTNALIQTPLRTKANPLQVMLENGELQPDHPGAYDIRIPYRGIEDHPGA